MRPAGSPQRLRDCRRLVAREAGARQAMERAAQLAACVACAPNAASLAERDGQTSPRASNAHAAACEHALVPHRRSYCVGVREPVRPAVEAPVLGQPCWSVARQASSEMWYPALVAEAEDESPRRRQQMWRPDGELPDGPLLRAT